MCSLSVCVHIYIIAKEVMILVTVNIDEGIVPSLKSGQLNDTLVLQLRKGGDLFITVTGNYLPSCFGSSLRTLVQLHTHIREVPVEQLADMVWSTSKSISLLNCRLVLTMRISFC